MISFHISCHVADFSKSYAIKKFCWKNGLINYLWEYLYSKFKQESLLTASFLLLWEFFFFNIKSWQWYITCGNSVRRKRTRITMRSRVVLSVLFLRLDLMFVGPCIRVCERMSNEESKKTGYRGSPDSTNFAHPGNRTIEKIVLSGDWFSTKKVKSAL